MLAAELVKQWTGGDRVPACAKYGHPFTYNPQGTLWFVGNNAPELPYEDDAAWRRVNVVPFTETIPKKEQDARLLEKIDKRAVLAWGVRGLRDYLKHGLNPPKASMLAKREHRAESNPVADFVERHCKLGPDYKVPLSDAYDAYLVWAKERGVREPLGKIIFGKCFSATSGVKQGRIGNPSRRVWLGVKT